MPRGKKPATVARTAAVELTEHVPVRHFMRYEVLAGMINREHYQVSTPMGGTAVYVEVGGRQFSVEAADLVKAIYLRLVVPARAARPKKGGGG